MIRNIIIILVSSISLLPLKSQDYQVVTGKSVVIDGVTSFGKFSCVYQKEDLQDTLQITQEHKEESFFDISLPVDDFGCGNKLLNKDFGKTLQSKEHPHMSVTVNHFAFENDRFESCLNVTLVGKTLALEHLPFELIEEQGKKYLEADFEVKFSQFEIEPPKKFLGLLKVKEELKVSLRLAVNEAPHLDY